MTCVCYILVYIFETIISYIYFENKYSVRKSKKYIFFAFLGMFIFQYSCNFVGVPNLNLAIFFATNFAVSFICYQCRVIQALFNSILLSALMLTSELCIFYIFKLLFNTEIMAYSTNETVLLVEASVSKLLYFLLAFILSKTSIKEKSLNFKLTKTFFLFLLPIASILLLIGIAYTTENYTLNNYVYTLFSIATILLIYSNIIVFWVHEATLKTQYENMELQLQKQKSEIDTEYYSILQEQYENSNILIHDIKRHLLSIKELSCENDYKGINSYIDNLYGSYQIKRLKKYSNNKLVNAIINRYALTCAKNGIEFYCDIRDIDFSFLSDNNLTALLDNLLENAVEAVIKSDKKIIELTIKPTNLNFVTIHIENSCSSEPTLKGGKPLTTKENKSLHGYGIKSIERIAKEYNGDIDYFFDKEEMLFTFKVILKIN